MINAATLAVKLQANTRGLQRDLRQAERSIQRSGTRMGAIATRIGAALGTALLAAGAASVNAASDVEELESKAKAVFGSLTRDVEVWAEATAEATGRSKFAFIDFASTLQDTLVPMGLARSEAAEVSMQLSELAVDLSSFANVGSDQALNALQSALVGNGRAMKQFGVIVNQTTTEQELLKQGIEGGIDAATEQEKVLARLGVVMAGTADAQGDAARTANEFANQRRALGAEVRELAVEIGEELLPAATELVGILTSLTGAIKDAGVSLVGLSVAGGALYTITRGLTKANAAAQALQATMMANPGVMGFATPPGKGNVFLEPKTLKKSMSATKAATGITQKLIATFGVLFLKVTAVVAVVAAAFFVYKRLTKGTGELTESVNDLAKAYGVLGDEAEDAGDKNNRVVPQALLEDSKQAAENITALREEIEKLRALRDRGVGGGNTVSGFSSPVGAQRDLDRRLEELDTAEETVDAIGRRIEAVSEARMFDGLLGTDLTAIEDDAVALLRTQQDATDVLGTLNSALAQNARQREEATDPAFRAALERDREVIESLRDSVAGFVEELIGMDVADFGSLADLEDQLDGIERKLENTTQQSELISLTREQVRLTGEIEDGERRIAEARVDARRDMPKTVQLLEDQIKDLETLEATADDVGEARFFRRARENAENDLEALEARILAFDENIERVELGLTVAVDEDTLDRIERILAGDEKITSDELGRRGVPDPGPGAEPISDSALAKLQAANGALGRFNQGLQSAIIQGSSLGDALVNSLKAVVAQLTAAVAQALVLKGIMAAMGMTDDEAKDAGFLGNGFGAVLGSVLGLATPFAKGGLAFGPALGLVGEGSDISKSNPEVIAPLSKLQGFMDGGGGGGVQRVEIVPRALPGGDIGWAVDESRRVSKRFR